MAALSHRNPAGGEAFRSRLVIGSLILILVLVLGLAWQASRTMRMHRVTADNVLRDYARLAADEFARRAMGAIGYYGYFNYINVLRRHVLDRGELPSGTIDADDREANAGRLARSLFLLDSSSGDIQLSGGPDRTADFERYLARRSKEFLQQALPESEFAIDHITLDGRPHTFVFSKTDEPALVFGFEVDRSELSAWLSRTFEQDALLPKSLAGGAITNEYVFVRFIDNDSNVLFESGSVYDASRSVSKAIGDEYEGIFEGHVIEAAIDPAIAESLVIGGLPGSRLPALLAVIALTVGLLIAAMRLLQREYALIRTRTDFVSEVSHELRTPLTQIRMFTETLLFERFRAADDRRRALEVINRETQRLTHLVENVLRFSDRDGDRDDLNIVDCALAPLIERDVAEFRPLAESAGATVETDLEPDATASVDSGALRQILLNLLDNAVKYGPPGQTVTVAVTRTPSGAQLSVSDQGPGIPRKDRERIWGGYFRLDRERRSEIAGTGIGLAVVRELAARQGGTAWVADGRDGGARFVVNLR